MTVTNVDAVRRTTTVRATPDRAFSVFTAGLGRWWNPDHTIGEQPLADAVLEPGVGGRWYEVGEDGGQCDWGRVLVWEPPHRLVLDWQISAGWQYDPDLHTEVEVRFTAVDEGTTRVDLEHRGLEAFGPAAASLRATFDSPGGWPGLLARFAEAADAS